MFFGRKPKVDQQRIKILFTTDLHGSTIAFRRWLTAVKRFAPDLAIIGGDVAGKALVPLVEGPAGWTGYLNDGPVSAATRADLSTALVLEAWHMATRRYPPAPGLLHHSDRGCQYASSDFQSLLQKSKACGSMSRRANKQFIAKDGLPGSAPYSFSVSTGSFEMSISSGALICIRYAISNALTRVAISGSPMTSSRASLSSLITSSVRRCIFSVIPAGLERKSTGSPLFLKGTP